jgi:triphosphoribosyl-dephospho-CoA synthase
MRIAAGRDRIAWNYANGLDDLFAVGAPRLQRLLARGWPESWAVTGTYLAFLARLPDTHILRKHGADVAEAVRCLARGVEERLLNAARPEEAAADLRRLDVDLKQRGINPGTSADLTVTSIFLAVLMAKSMVGIAETVMKRV